jgi:hypothetical protein
MPRAIVQLTPGKPEVIALKFAKGKEYGDRTMFSTCDDRILYLDADEAKELERMDIPKETPFSVTRVRNGKGGTRCEFARLNGQANGSANGSAPSVPVPIPAQANAPTITAGPTAAPAPITPLAAKVLASYLTAVDCLMEAQVYAQRKGLVIAITCEDVRCLAATIMINAEGMR